MTSRVTAYKSVIDYSVRTGIPGLDLNSLIDVKVTAATRSQQARNARAIHMGGEELGAFA